MTLLDERPAPVPVPAARPPAPHRSAVVAALVVAAVLLATALGLGLRLPDETVAAHWSLAWSGLDVTTASVAVVTAVLLARDDRRAALPAAAGAALLVLDAWFDVCTAASTSGLLLAVGEAVLLELPLAVLSARLAVRLLAPRPGARVSG